MEFAEKNLKVGDIWRNQCTFDTQEFFIIISEDGWMKSMGVFDNNNNIIQPMCREITFDLVNSGVAGWDTKTFQLVWQHKDDDWIDELSVTVDFN